jgi:hypothetical protein
LGRKKIVIEIVQFFKALFLLFHLSRITVEFTRIKLEQCANYLGYCIWCVPSPLLCRHRCRYIQSFTQQETYFTEER